MVEIHRKGDWVGSDYIHHCDYVLATDYAALEAERDEWKRRCEAIVELLKPAPDEKLQKMYAEDLHVEYALRELHPDALAIAEGGDNG